MPSKSLNEVQETGVNKLSTSKLVICALFAALIAVLAQFAIPLPFSPVPLTGQVIGVMVAGAVLGSKAGVLSITAYLMLGAAGAPVFSLGRGGIYMLTGPGGGYLWGFIPAVYLIGWIIERSDHSLKLPPSLAMLLGLMVIYLCGAIQLGLIMRYSPGQVFMVGVLPFIPLDLLKVAFSVYLYSHIKNSLSKNRLSHIINS